jgi:hypothetical protein
LERKYDDKALIYISNIVKDTTQKMLKHAYFHVRSLSWIKKVK